MSGRSHGYDDANTWIDELRTTDHLDDEKIENRVRSLLNWPITADESLINAMTPDDLAKLIGFDVYGDDGFMTAEAAAWFTAYNAGWREACEAKLRELAA